MTPIEHRAIALVAQLAGRHPQEITVDATWRMLGLDSLDIVALLVDCEQEFGITISDEDAMAFASVTDLISYLATQ